MVSKPDKVKYDESSIQVLEGLEAVRKRPGMYIGSTDSKGLHHLVWEIVDNSIDEALAGEANEINVILEKNGSITVVDNGRGIPTGMHKTGKSTPEVIFTVLHAGGKFENNGGYKTSGGLHGVGSSVVNALSSDFKVTIYRDKKVHEIEFANGGKIKTPLHEIGVASKTGTAINFIPDTTIFSDLKFSFGTISNRLKESALLTPGLKITLKNNKDNREVIYQFEEGLKEFVKELSKNETPITEPVVIQDYNQKIHVDLALGYVDSYDEKVVTFANNVKTTDGGTHLIGFKSGLSRALNEFGRKMNLIKDKGLRLDYNDYKEGIVAVLNVKVPENLIQYEGQTKGRLGTPEARTIVENVTYENLLYWLQENKVIAQKILDKAILAKTAREEARKARQAIRENKNLKTNLRSMLGKLTPAQGRDRERNELYLVEGDSAGGSAKSGRDRTFQAILPLKGKVINSEKTKLNELLKNDEIKMIVTAIGAGVGNNFNIDNINYGKIVIMTDADTDGAHIQTLLLTFFFRHMVDLIYKGKVFLALPPLYKITFSDKSIEYLWNEDELAKFVETTKQRYELQRYKGLGEMNAEQLWETTMDPKHRKLIKVTIEDAEKAHFTFKILMGDDVEKRKAWIDHHVKFTLESDGSEISTPEIHGTLKEEAPDEDQKE